MARGARGRGACDGRVQSRGPGRGSLSPSDWPARSSIRVREVAQSRSEALQRDSRRRAEPKDRSAGDGGARPRWPGRWSLPPSDGPPGPETAAAAIAELRQSPALSSRRNGRHAEPRRRLRVCRAGAAPSLAGRGVGRVGRCLQAPGRLARRRRRRRRRSRRRARVSEVISK